MFGLSLLLLAAFPAAPASAFFVAQKTKHANGGTARHPFLTPQPTVVRAERSSPLYSSIPPPAQPQAQAPAAPAQEAQPMAPPPEQPMMTPPQPAAPMVPVTAASAQQQPASQATRSARAPTTIPDRYMDNMAPGLGWWKGVYPSESIATSPLGVGYPSVSYYGVFSDSASPAHDYKLQEATMIPGPPNKQRRMVASISVLAQNQGNPGGRRTPFPREGRTWWIGVEGGIGYCQGGA